MTSNLTEKDIKWMACSARSIAKLDKSGVSEKELRRMLYQLGVYFYRNFHGVGLPVEMSHPSLAAPKKIWDKTTQRYVPEEQLATV